jgi:hypothetical protein
VDTRRLNTGQVIAAGILNRPMPRTDIPSDREVVEIDFDVSPEAITEAVERGAVVVCSEYYGIPNLWKDGEVYRGCLLQYRAVTEAPVFDALEPAVEWFSATAAVVAG